MSAPIVAVRPRAAALMLSIGKTKLYELIESGELRTCKVGHARLVPVSEIQRLVSGRANGGVSSDAPQQSPVKSIC